MWLREAGNENPQGKKAYFSNTQDYEIETETKTLNKSFLILIWESYLVKCYKTISLDLKKFNTL